MTSCGLGIEIVWRTGCLALKELRKDLTHSDSKGEMCCDRVSMGLSSVWLYQGRVLSPCGERRTGKTVEEKLRSEGQMDGGWDTRVGRKWSQSWQVECWTSAAGIGAARLKRWAEVRPCGLIGQGKGFTLSQEQWADIQRLFKQREKAFTFCIFEMIMLERAVT